MSSMPVPPRPRKRHSHVHDNTLPERPGLQGLLKRPLPALAVVIVLLATSTWARRWLYSGSAILSVILVYGHYDQTRVLPSLPLWTLLATLNLAYAVCSTSWLLYALFAIACYPTILLTILFQSSIAANWARRSLRRTLRQLHFTRDKIAVFNLPALEIDVDVDGLLVIRGVSISLSSLTIVAHGIEVGIKLAHDIELALYVDEVNIPLFRRIEIGDVYGNIKGGSNEMTFADLDDDNDDAGDDDSVVQVDTPMLRAANAGSKAQRDRPKLRQSLTGVSYMKDASARAGMESVTTLSADDAKAEEAYFKMVEEIRTDSAIYQSRQQARHAAKGENGFSLETEKETRAVVCAELHNLPTIMHPPELSVRVTTLQSLAPPYVRRFLHRLPMLLRLLLALLSYCHPVTISSINGAGSGHWLSALLRQQIFKHYVAENASLRRLERKVSAWLAKANFCVIMADIEATSQVPLSTMYDIVAFLQVKDCLAFRTVHETAELQQVVRLGGADATFSIPSYLLPHHEHILPPEPTVEMEHELQIQVDDADGKPQKLLAELEKERVLQDDATISLSVHGSLPAQLDQSLLNFVAALVKATKMIEFEKEVDEQEQMSGSAAAAELEKPISPPSFQYDSDGSTRPPSPTKSLPGSIGGREPSTSGGFKGFVKTLHRSTKSMKNNILGGVVNDRWVAKAVGKIAAKLENAHGDLGYSGEIKVPLAPYRPIEELSTKLLP